MKKFFEKAFPFISVAATTLGGPVGIIGAQVLGKVLGKEGMKPSDISEAITAASATEEGVLKLKQAEQEFEVRMKELGYDHIEKLEEVAAADRDSARHREMTVRDRMPMILAISVCVMFFAVVTVLLFRQPPEGGRDAMLILLGALVGGWKDVYGYYFGSSAGSAAKDALLRK